ncbi:MAG: hypothetical protein H6674_10980 [Dehalococcoidia bacterium]|nr:hypothetical protein [Dehalococcoidia bacterium]
MTEITPTAIFLRNRVPPLRGADEDDIAPAADALISIFGAEWLQTPGNHVLQRLWARPDWLAGQELLTLGHALHRLRATNPPNKLAAVAAQLKRDDDNNVHGALWEVLCGGMIDPANRRVEMNSQGGKAFDLLVNDDDGVAFRVSCKSLLPSQPSREAQRDAAAMWTETRAGLLPSARVSLIVVDPPRTKPRSPMSRQRLRKAVRELARRYAGEPTSTQVGATSVWLAPYHLARPAGHELPLHPERSAIYFAHFRSHHPNEQVRFRSKLDEAARKYQKAGFRGGDDALNLVAVRLPVEIDMASALLALDRWWEASDELSRCVDGVLLYRCTCVPPRVVAPASEFVLHHEAQLRFRPGAGRLTDPLHLSLPIGATSSEPVAFAARVGPFELSLGEGYFWHRGEETRWLRTDDGTGTATLSGGLDGVVSQLFMTGFQGDHTTGLVMTPRLPPVAELLILTPGSVVWA